jgi:C1A family cysteine protease
MINLFLYVYTMMYNFVVALLMIGVASSANLRVDRFEQWLDEFRIMIHSNEHRQHLYRNWMENDKYIEESNSRNLTYTLGHNHLSGMDSDEFSQYMGFESNNKELSFHIDTNKIMTRITEIKCLGECVHDYDQTDKLSTVRCVKDCLTQNDELQVTSVPASINWVDLGAVTPVKNQGQCGSCWSFSTTGAMEGAYFVANNKLVSFSEQELVDCDNVDKGCNGGLMDNAFKWVEKNGGLCSESDYKYESGTTMKAGACDKSCTNIPNSEIKSYTDVKQRSDNAMMEAVAQQPVAIAIQANQKDFQLYKSGVFTGSCGTRLDHGVLTVGYGTSKDGIDYYKVKNSWGTSWGDNGYILLGRGDEYNRGQGQCGMLMSASYPEF